MKKHQWQRSSNVNSDILAICYLFTCHVQTGSSSMNTCCAVTISIANNRVILSRITIWLGIYICSFQLTSRTYWKFIKNAKPKAMNRNSTHITWGVEDPFLWSGQWAMKSITTHTHRKAEHACTITKIWRVDWLLQMNESYHQFSESEPCML